MVLEPQVWRLAGALWGGAGQRGAETLLLVPIMAVTDRCKLLHHLTIWGQKSPRAHIKVWRGWVLLEVSGENSSPRRSQLLGAPTFLGSWPLLSSSKPAAPPSPHTTSRSPLPPRSTVTDPAITWGPPGPSQLVSLRPGQLISTLNSICYLHPTATNGTSLQVLGIRVWASWGAVSCSPQHPHLSSLPPHPWTVGTVISLDGPAALQAVQAPSPQGRGTAGCQGRSEAVGCDPVGQTSGLGRFRQLAQGLWSHLDSETGRLRP